MSEQSAPPAANAPFQYAVLVPKGPIKISAGQFDGWTVHYANGDLASARAKAEEWAQINNGALAVVVAYVDHVQTVTQAKWAKP